MALRLGGLSIAEHRMDFGEPISARRRPGHHNDDHHGFDRRYLRAAGAQSRLGTAVFGQHRHRHDCACTCRMRSAHRLAPQLHDLPCGPLAHRADAGTAAPPRRRHPRLAQPSTTRLEPGPVVGIFALAAVGTAVLWLLTLQFAFHLAEIGYASPVVAGLGLGAPCVAGVAAAHRTHPHAASVSRQTAALAFALMGLGYALISFTASLPALGIGLLLAGFGFGFNQPNCVAWLLVGRARKPAGAAAGLTFAICLGQLVSPFLYDPLVFQCWALAPLSASSPPPACWSRWRPPPHPSEPSPLTHRTLLALMGRRAR